MKGWNLILWKKFCEEDIIFCGLGLTDYGYKALYRCFITDEGHYQEYLEFTKKLVSKQN